MHTRFIFYYWNDVYYVYFFKNKRFKLGQNIDAYCVSSYTYLLWIYKPASSDVYIYSNYGRNYLHWKINKDR